MANTLNEKEEHKHSDHDNLVYFGIRELENLIANDDDYYYYKPVLVRSSFEKYYEYYEIREKVKKIKHYQ